MPLCTFLLKFWNIYAKWSLEFIGFNCCLEFCNVTLPHFPDCSSIGGQSSWLVLFCFALLLLQIVLPSPFINFSLDVCAGFSVYIPRSDMCIFIYQSTFQNCFISIVPPIVHEGPHFPISSLRLDLVRLDFHQLDWYEMALDFN